MYKNTDLTGILEIGTAGHVENALTFSPVQLVIDAEIARCVRRMLRGVEVSDESLCVDAIMRVGPDATFLNDEESLRHLVNEVDGSELFQCMPWDIAHAAGRESIVQLARRTAERLMAAEPEPVLSRDQEREIDEIVNEAAGKLGISLTA